METDEIEDWILDTLWEDDYTFVEMTDYLKRGNVGIEEQLKSFMRLYEIKFLRVAKYYNSNNNPALNDLDQIKALMKFEEIVIFERKNNVVHFFQITDDGQKHLKSKGFYQ